MINRSNTWFFIINPASGNGRTRQQWNQIKTFLHQKNIPFDNAFTEGKLHAISLVQEAVQNGYRKIVAVGGDGTNNEVINGIVQQDIIPSNAITYALLPVGTGNDWIKQHRIPQKIGHWTSILQAEKTILHDVGKVLFHEKNIPKERYFINVAGMAYDGYVGRELHFKNGHFLRRLQYLYAALACLFKYQLRKVKIEFDGITVEDYCYLINTGICQYSGGGMRMVPHANPQNGQLALTIARNLSKTNVIKSLPLLYNGKIGKHPLITLHHTSHIKVTASENRPTFLEVDGEFLGETPVEISIIPKALKIVIP